MVTLGKHLNGQEEDNVELIQKLFRMDVESFCEKLLNLKTYDMVLSVPINVDHNQYLISISKEKDMLVMKLTLGSSAKVVKSIEGCPSVFILHGAVAGDITIKKFFNQCLRVMFSVVYKAFVTFVNQKVLLKMIEDYIFEKDKKGAKTLKDYIKFCMKENMMNAYSMVEGVEK